MWMQSCFKSGFWNAFWNAKKRAFWIVIRLESLILGHVNAKLFRNVIRACAFWKCALKPCWSHAWVNQRGLRSRSKILPRSAQILIVIGKACYIPVLCKFHTTCNTCINFFTLFCALANWTMLFYGKLCSCIRKRNPLSSVLQDFSCNQWRIYGRGGV